MRTAKLFLPMFSFVIGFSTSAFAATYYVAPTGTVVDLSIIPVSTNTRQHRDVAGPVVVPGPDTQFSVTRPVGENFVRDGMEQRYWGVNINLQPWHTLDSIERMTTRIQRVGFNSIRLWPNWKTFYGMDVRNSATPPPQGFHFATYVKGDGSQLDLFDKMVHECRQKKMPIYMTSLMYYPPLYTTGDYVDLVTTDAADRQAWIDAMSRKRWV